MMGEDAVLRKRLVQLGLGESGDTAGGGGGGGGGGEEESIAPPTGPGGGAAPEAEKASKDGSGLLKPKWSVSSEASEAKINKIYKNTYQNERLITALSKIDPNIVAELHVPRHKALVPYRD
jgi:hypothetical protein